MRALSLPLLLATLGLLALPSPPTLAADVEVQLPAGDGFVVKDNTGTVERFRVDEATGNISRNGALFVHTTGTNNTFVGRYAGTTGTRGFGRNSAFGYSALLTNTTGASNSAVGAHALQFNTTGNSNSAVGTYALATNTTGNRNSAFGSAALLVNTTADNNSAFGYGALFANTTGDSNSAVGALALQSNTSGGDNSALGWEALRSNTTGYSNSAFGKTTLRNNTTGNRNSALGFAALGLNTSGFANSAFGSETLLFNTTGSYNVAVGRSAGYNQTTGSNNIYIANTGVAAESYTTHIGQFQTRAFIAGIRGRTTGIANAIPVLVDSAGQLGTTSSSRSVKQEIRDRARRRLGSSTCGR